MAPLVEQFLLETPALAWITNNWFRSLWNAWCIIWGVLTGALFYSVYVIIVDVFKTLPVN